MEIEILKKDEIELKFLVKGISVPLVNALRRIFISEMPSIAVDYLKFYKNNSPVFDEIIAHRVGLIPLNNASEIYITPEECGWKKGENAQSHYLLKNWPLHSILQRLSFRRSRYISIFGDIPPTKLGEGQELKFDAVARLGTAEHHANGKCQCGV